jgi:hypothetical protein
VTKFRTRRFRSFVRGTPQYSVLNGHSNRHDGRSDPRWRHCPLWPISMASPFCSAVCPERGVLRAPSEARSSIGLCRPEHSLGSQSPFPRPRHRASEEKQRETKSVRNPSRAGCGLARKREQNAAPRRTGLRGQFGERFEKRAGIDSGWPDSERCPHRAKRTGSVRETSARPIKHRASASRSPDQARGSSDSRSSLRRRGRGPDS